MKLNPEQITELQAALPKMDVSEIARTIQLDWMPVWFGAVPYLNAMRGMTTVNDRVFNDSGTDVINYFIGNAVQWRGDVARLVKAELRRRLKQK